MFDGGWIGWVFLRALNGAHATSENSKQIRVLRKKNSVLSGAPWGDKIQPYSSKESTLLSVLCVSKLLIIIADNYQLLLSIDDYY